MALSIFFFIVATFLGICLAIFFIPKINRLALFSFGLTIGTFLLTFIIFCSSFLLGFNRLTIFLSIILALLFSIWFCWQQNLSPKIKVILLAKSFKKKERIILFLFLFLWLLIFTKIWSQMLVSEKDGLYAGWISIWGDWAAHLSYSNSFAFGNNFPPQNPLLAGEPFSYPFLADFLAAILTKSGFNMFAALILSSFLFSFVLLVNLFVLAKQLLKKVFPAIVATSLVLLNGGLGFILFFKNLRQNGLRQILSQYSQEYTHVEDWGLEWINIITSEFVPQRGFLLGVALGLIVLYLLWLIYQKPQRKLLFLAGLITSGLPLIHAHSFAVILFLSGFLALLKIRKPKHLIDWSFFALPILIFSLPQIFYFYPHLGSRSFLKIKLGWMAYKTKDNIIWFWFKNLGFSLPLIIWGFILAKKKLKVFYLPFLALFVLANVFLFQPWEWDNTKIFTYWYIPSSFLAALALNRLWQQKNTFKKIVAICLFALTILSGSLDILYLTNYNHNKIRFFTNQQLEIASIIREKTPPEAIFLIAPSHDHLVPVLTGRKILLGFRGWLWTYGIDYKKREIDVFKMLRGEKNALNLLKKYQVNYVVVGPKELSKEIKINQEFFHSHFPIFLDKHGYTIFKIAPSKKIAPFPAAT